METVETGDTLSFMQGQTTALELVLRAIISDSPELRAKFVTAVGRLAGDLAQEAPPEFVKGWYHSLRCVNGGPFPVVGQLKG